MYPNQGVILMLLLGILILELILISGMVTKRRGLFTTLTVKGWYHVACVYDGSEAIIYANGKIDNKKKFEGEPKHNGANFWMGARKSDGLSVLLTNFACTSAV